MAQDFYAAFGLGSDDRTINLIDANGVALACIKALDDTVRDQAAELTELRQRLESVERGHVRMPGQGSHR